MGPMDTQSVISCTLSMSTSTATCMIVKKAYVYYSHQIPSFNGYKGTERYVAVGYIYHNQTLWKSTGYEMLTG